VCWLYPRELEVSGASLRLEFATAIEWFRRRYCGVF